MTAADPTANAGITQATLERLTAVAVAAKHLIEDAPTDLEEFGTIKLTVDVYTLRLLQEAVAAWDK